MVTWLLGDCHEQSEPELEFKVISELRIGNSFGRSLVHVMIYNFTTKLWDKIKSSIREMVINTGENKSASRISRHSKMKPSYKHVARFWCHLSVKAEQLTLTCLGSILSDLWDFIQALRSRYSWKHADIGYIFPLCSALPWSPISRLDNKAERSQTPSTTSFFVLLTWWRGKTVELTSPLFHFLDSKHAFW